MTKTMCQHKTSGKRLLTIDNVIDAKSVSDAQINPDGLLVAFVLASPYQTSPEMAVSNIWIVPSDGGPSKQFTSGSGVSDTPRWSPDGKTLAFLSNRTNNQDFQIYVMPRSGGEGIQITEIQGITGASRSVTPMAWSPDGTKIAFLRTEPKPREQTRSENNGYDAIEFEKHPRFTYLWTVDVSSRNIRRVSPEVLQIWEFSWAPNNKEFAAVVSDLPYEKDWYTNRLATFSSNSKSLRNINSTNRQVARPVWSPDKKTIAFLSSNFSDRGITPGAIFTTKHGNKIIDVCSSHRSSVTQMDWLDDSKHLMTVGQLKGGYAIAKVNSLNGSRQILWKGEVDICDDVSTFSKDNRGTLALVREDPMNPPDVWILRVKHRQIVWRKLSDLHPNVTDLELGATESICWKGARGWNIQGWFIHPPKRFGDGPHPMITIPHGGPTGVSSPTFHAANRGYQLLARLGYAVFLPNFRGSTGWGLRFAESNIGDMGGKDWEDIQKGIDHCIDTKKADCEKLGIMGHSYGGYLAAWAVTQTERFRASIISAGICDWRSFHGRSRISKWDSLHYGGADPWDPDGIFRKFSPITHVRNVKTPTLILHGQDDQDVPVDQAYEFYRALRDVGVDSELVVYPREGHGIRNERNHRLDYFKRIESWFQGTIPV